MRITLRQTRADAIVMLLVCMLSFAGCMTAGEIRLDERHNDSDIKIGQGKFLTISLDSNASTGYNWELVANGEPYLEETSDATAYPSNPQSPSMPGSACRLGFHFKAVEKGDAIVVLNYRRAWETNKPPLQTFTVHVTVR